MTWRAGSRPRRRTLRTWRGGMRTWRAVARAGGRAGYPGEVSLTATRGGVAVHGANPGVHEYDSRT